MRLIYIITYAPTPVRTRSYNLLRQMAQRGHDLTLVTTFRNDEEAEAVEAWRKQRVRVIASPISKAQTVMALGRGALSGEPMQAWFDWQPALAAQIKKLITTEVFDVAHIEHVRAAKYGLAMMEIPNQSGVLQGLSRVAGGEPSAQMGRPPIVWDAVDCISALFEQTRQHAAGQKSRWMAAAELGRTRRFETRCARNFDRTLAISQKDRDALAALAPERSERAAQVWRAGLDCDYFAPQNLPRDPSTLIFSGKMSYHANATAAAYLLSEIMPRVWQAKPQTRLKIVGQNPPESLGKLAAQAAGEVVLTGRVEDMRPHLAQATLAVAPLVYGAGAQFKVLEAMGMGTPVVASPLVLNGIAASEGGNILIGAGAEAFAQKILLALDDAPLRQRLGEAGRAFVLAHHAWPQVAADLEQIYLEAGYG
ncbi:MAG TPA: glycosyltransferase family 4 protein [Thermoflexales bacterium]|nr:glycosyltransferase family 4 protein [Thermoflexales bacterium]HQW35391.1 glycosyltransferase family 4 protein [Thermoflexales bacterium]HQZ21145.1 glycosyltransferase family 4 protein [Thermoflexales bacterium]HRA00444.1 glycosyltransferase family 4 protein [Thermoflexales bacterium]